MNTHTIKIVVFDIIGGNSAISPADGDTLFKQIDKFLSEKQNVELDFANITLITTAFLNAAIGQLYSKYTGVDLNTMLSLKNIAPEDVPLFKKVIERAKEFFANPSAFDQTAKETFGNE